MGCNCATQEQIKKLYDTYGEKNSQQKPLKQKIGDFFKTFVINLIIFLISPLLIGFVLYITIFTKEKKISIRKLLGFKKKDIDKTFVKNIIENTNIVESE